VRYVGGCVVYDVVDDKITEGRVYLEAPPLMAQLGVLR
jgi:hypothetical protein